MRADLLTPELDRVLYRIYQKARGSVLEQGINILFLAFGMLHWSETPTSLRNLAPLVLVPVQLQRKTALDPFQIVPHDDEVAINPTLIEKLRTQFGVEIDPKDDDQLIQPLSEVLESLRSVLTKQPGWSVESEVYLGLFQFHKLSMYRDLEIYADQARAHPVIRALAGEAQAMPPLPADLPNDADLDVKVLPQDTFQILDADASQMRAIVAAVRGGSFIVQGPPGTGKSQTIANIIAECLAAGKSVLFVSEKAAALEVVYSRLSSRGLADFCLELHSHRANKKTVLAELGRALEEGVAHRAPRSGESLLSELLEVRSRLNRYAEALLRPREPLNLSCYEVYGRLAAVSDAPDVLCQMPDPLKLTQKDLAHFRSLIRQLQANRDTYLEGTAHPWSGVTFDQVSLNDRAALRTCLRDLRAKLHEGEALVRDIADALGLEPPQSIVGYRWLVETATLAQENAGVPAVWLTSLSLAPYLEAARGHQQEAHRYQERRTELLTRYRAEVLSLDAAERLATLSNLSALEVFGRNGESGADRVLRERDPIDTRLKRATDAIRALEERARPLAAMLDERPPSTLREARRLARLAVLSGRAPQPTPSWFSRANLERLASLAEQAGQHKATIDGELPTLLARCDKAILELATADFVSSYERRGPLRFVQPAYWRDRKRIRVACNHPGKLSFTEEVEALRRAQRIAEARAWYDEHESELTTVFGSHFAGHETDWSSVSESLSTMREILDLTQEHPNAALTQILTDLGSSAAVLTELGRQLDEAVARAVAAIDELLALAPSAPILTAPGGMENVDLADLAAWATTVHDRARQFWAVSDEVVSFRCNAEPTTFAQLLADLQEIAHLQDAEREMARDHERLRAEFGPLFAGLDTRWDNILAALHRAERLRAQFVPAQPPPAFVERVARPGGISELAELVGRAVKVRCVIDEELSSLMEMFVPESLRLGDAPMEAVPLSIVADWVQKRLERFGELDDWLKLKRVMRDLDSAGLTGFAEAIRQQGISPEHWDKALEKRLFTLWLDCIHRDDPTLGEFSGATQDEVVRTFRLLDVQQLDLAAWRVQDILASRRPQVGGLGGLAGGEAAILRTELLKKRRHKPLRRLFSEIPNLLMALKPCLLMSPLSVSLFLPADVYQFDVVIFDEASQVRPQDAVGAIMRGKQVIVVGDRKQLPPTAFFEASADDLEEEDEEEAHGAFESILDECDARGMPSFMLRWHYRSRHESLIAFSNVHFYDSKLITFPSADPQAPDMGVKLVHVPDGIYYRREGRTNPRDRTNRVEARRVAQLVVEQHGRHPERSLGVVTLSEAQMLAVLDELEMLRRRDPSLEVLFDENRPEPFFVKNLEQVQGDERDTVILSIGYGRDTEGRMSMHFGPLNRAGGERRLNVAVTRARNQVIVVSSILAADIDLSRAQSRGAHLLHAYLAFAERGGAAPASVATPDAGDFESPFEESVGTALEARGFTVHRQVGCSGYRIDLAVVDPDQPGCYLLGIECDGATYHSSKTARERDRLRQQVLEQLGWRIHRVWSTDWIRDPARELQRIMAAIDRVRSSGRTATEPELSPTELDTLVTDLDVPTSPGWTAENEASAPLAPTGPSKRRVETYRRAELGNNLTRWGPFHEAPFHAIVDAVAQCVQQEGPIHRSLLASRVAESWSLQRVGSKVQQRITAAILSLTRSGRVEEREEFVWPAGVHAVVARGPSADGEVRRIQEVPLEEIADAARICTGDAFALPREELVVATARALGYDRTGIHVFERVNRGIDLAIDQGLIATRGGRITVEG